ncbi:unnamed protein product [Spirodela intermedia]|uniref:Uncharacterized protein n=1 Tax=Spirodela intermedia TaxID=51605 RepID=A0A7I8JQX3_SPIIN|nr:unnamed protein product [Spirodela intermedia]CAA6672550.1 unnamed protein product [Spirodela intermedia]
MKWVVESSPAAVTRRSGKTATLRLSAAVTRRRGAGWRWARVRELHPQVRAARGGSSSHLVRSQEVATGLPADRPLPDDGLFVDQSEMIYSMDCDPFIANRSEILVAMLRESR